MNKSNVIMFENGMQNNFAVKTRNVLNEKQNEGRRNFPYHT